LLIFYIFFIYPKPYKKNNIKVIYYSLILLYKFLNILKKSYTIPFKKFLNILNFLDIFLYPKPYKKNNIKVIYYSLILFYKFLNILKNSYTIAFKN